MPKSTAKELIGNKYNRLTVVALAFKNEKQHVFVKAICDCGNEKLLSASSIRLGRVKSCGCLPRDNGKINAPKIKNKAKGKNNANWKGGITSENEKQRKSDTYKNWRLSVFARDGFTCKKCLCKKRKIEAHHLYNFSDYPELRFSLDNGVTLCKDCHKSFHKIFGYNNSTTEHQFYAFINQ